MPCRQTTGKGLKSGGVARGERTIEYASGVLAGVGLDMICCRWLLLLLQGKAAAENAKANR